MPRRRRRRLSMTPSAVAKRQRRQDPVKAAIDRKASLAWKHSHPAERKAYDVQREIDLRGECEVCSGPTGQDNTSGTCQRCIAAGAEFRRGLIVDFWAAGHSIIEIAEMLGSTPGSIGCSIVRMRAAGYDLPRRYSVSDAGRRVAA